MPDQTSVEGKDFYFAVCLRCDVADSCGGHRSLQAFFTKVVAAIGELHIISLRASTTKDNVVGIGCASYIPLPYAVRLPQDAGASKKAHLSPSSIVQNVGTPAYSPSFSSSVLISGKLMAVGSMPLTKYT